MNKKIRKPRVPFGTSVHGIMWKIGLGVPLHACFVCFAIWIGFACPFAKAQELLYFDDFSGNGTGNLNQTTPDTAVSGSVLGVDHGTGGAWTARSGQVLDDGRVAPQVFASAKLPFSPKSGFVYKLTVRDITPTAQYLTAGFAGTYNTRSWLEAANGGFLSGYVTSAGVYRAYDDSDGGLGHIAAESSGNTVPGDLVIVLDTRDGSGLWDVEWVFNGTSFARLEDISIAYETGIQSVGLGFSNSSAGSYGSIELTVLGDPAWTELVYENFENGFGNWVDGGTMAVLSATNAIGTQCAQLQDGLGNDSTIWLKNNLNLTGHTELKVDFSCVTEGLDAGERLVLQYSENGGSSWKDLRSFVAGIDLENGIRSEQSVVIGYLSFYFWQNDIKLRFQSDAGSTDRICLDNIRISARNKTVEPRWEIIPQHPDYPFYDTPVAAIQVTDERLTNRLPADPANEDCTATFQEAIDAVHNQGGGMVFVPEGEYLINGNLNVRKGLTLRGHWQAPTNTGWKTGTVLNLVPRLSAEDDPASITTESDCGVKSLNFYYPEQDPNNVRAYPPTIKAGGGLSFSDLTFVNSYWAIDANPGSAFALWQGIYGSPIEMGMYSGQGVALPRYMVIEFSPKFWEWWPMDNAVPNVNQPGNYAHHMYNQGTGIVLLEHDGFNFNIGEVEGYFIGLQAGDLNDLGVPLGNESPNGSVRDFRAHDCQTAFREITSRISFYNTQLGNKFYRYDQELVGSWQEVLDAMDEDPEAPVGLDYRTDWNRSRKPARAVIYDVTDSRFAGGAKGDKTADDTAAVRAAITAATTDGGGIVFFPPGVYRLTSPITAGDGIELCGSAGSRVGGYKTSRGGDDDYGSVWLTGIIYGDYTGDPEGTALLTLGSGSGIRTLGFFSDHQNMQWVLAGNDLIEEPFMVRMSGLNNYAISPFASNPYQFLDFVNCDGFLVEHFMASGTHNIFRVRNSSNGRIQFGHNKPGDWLGGLADANTFVDNRDAYRSRMPALGLTAIRLYDSDNINMAHIFNRCSRALIRINNSTGNAITVKGEECQSGYIFETGVPERVYRIIAGHVTQSGLSDGTGAVGVDLLEGFDGIAECINGHNGNPDYHFRVKSGHLYVQNYDGGGDLRQIEVAGTGSLDLVDTTFADMTLNVGPEASLYMENVTCSAFPAGNLQGNFTFMNLTYDKDFIYTIPKLYSDHEYGIRLLPDGTESSLLDNGALLISGNSFFIDITEPRFMRNAIGDGTVSVNFLLAEPITVDQVSVKAYYQSMDGEQQAVVSSGLKEFANNIFNISFQTPEIWATADGSPEFRLEITSPLGLEVVKPKLRDVVFSIPKQGDVPLAATPPDQFVPGASNPVHTGSIVFNNNDSNNAVTKTWTFSNMNNANLTVSGNAATAAGPLTSAGAFSPSDSFKLTASCVMGWNDVSYGTTAEQAYKDGNFANYLNGLPAGRIDALSDGINPDSRNRYPSDSTNEFGNGSYEAVVITVDSVNLSSGKLYLLGLNFGFGTVGDKLDFVICDANNNVLYKSWNSSVQAGINGDWELKQGDKIIIGTGVSNGNNIFRLSSLDLDVIVPPVPPTGLTATAGDGNVSLNWTHPSEAELWGYGVYRANSPTSGYFHLRDVRVSEYVDDKAISGHSYYYVVTALDGVGSESDPSNEAAARIDNYSVWANSYGGSEVIGPPTHDHDGDGLANLGEYALDGDPTDRTDTGAQPAIYREGETMFYTHPKRSDDDSLIYTVEVSTDLASDHWSPAGFTVFDTDITGSTLDHVIYTVPTTEPRMFIRLQIGR